MTPEEQFQNELEVFRTEAESASQFLFGYFAVHAVAFDRKDVHRLLNTAPLFWNSVLGALQMSAHIALGRVFDQKSTHNVDRVLRLSQQIQRSSQKKRSVAANERCPGMQTNGWRTT
jgi:AbiU2